MIELTLVNFLVVLAVLSFLLLLWLTWRTVFKPEASSLGTQLEEKHRAMLLDLNDGLNKLGDRLNTVLADSSERLKQGVALELNQTREAMQALQLAQTDNLAKNREALLEKLNSTFETLNKTVEGRLDLISGKVSER